MADNADNLLRLLEPAVRPGNAPAANRTARPPVEARDFDSLLAEAQEGQSPEEAESASDAKSPNRASPLDALGRIENASVAQLMGRVGGAGATKTPGHGT